MNRTLSPARQAAIAEAIACADCALNNAALPQYGELLEALRTAQHFIPHGEAHAAARRRVAAVLAAQTAA